MKTMIAPLSRLGMYWALIIFTRPNWELVCISLFMPVQDYLCLSDFLLSFLPPEGPVFISEASITHREGMKQPSNYREKASKPERLNFPRENGTFTFNLPGEFNCALWLLCIQNWRQSVPVHPLPDGTCCPVAPAAGNNVPVLPVL